MDRSIPQTTRKTPTKQSENSRGMIEQEEPSLCFRRGCQCFESVFGSAVEVPCGVWGVVCACLGDGSGVFGSRVRCSSSAFSRTGAARPPSPAPIGVSEEWGARVGVFSKHAQNAPRTVAKRSQNTPKTLPAHSQNAPMQMFRKCSEKIKK